MKDFLKRYWFKSLILIIIIVGIPILANLLVMSSPFIGVPSPNNDWIGFFGSYISSIIAAILAAVVAIYITSMQIKKQSEYHAEQIDQQRENLDIQLAVSKKDQMINNRSYVTLQELWECSFLLSEIQTSPKSRIIKTEEYDKFVSNHKLTATNQMNYLTSFYKFTLHGLPDCIFDVHIEVNFMKPKIRIIKHISVFEKDEELFFPLFCGMNEKEVEVDSVTINYKTVVGENLKYIYYPNNNKEMYFTINDKLQEEMILNLSMRNTEWIYPARIKNR